MNVNFFVTCIGDALKSRMARDSVLLLEKLGCRVNFPEKQGCCGQPAINSGYTKEAIPGMKNLIAALEDNDDPIISPAGSCTYANRKNADLKFFEFGNCYFYNAEKKNPEKVLAAYAEEYHLGLWVTGKRVSNSWAHPDENSSVYELKAYVLNIFTRLGLNFGNVVFGNLTNDIYSTAISVHTRGGKLLATFGIISKKIQKAFDIDNEVYYAEINWKELMKAIKSAKVNFKELSKFPAVKRDLALLIDKNIQFAEIEKIAYETEKKLLKEVELFDVYEGKNLEPGKKSYAVSFLLQDESATLNDKQIDKIMSKLIANLENKLGAKLR